MKASDWISVDSPPKIGEKVLVYIEPNDLMGKGHGYAYPAVLEKSGWRMLPKDDFWKGHTITRWMPIVPPEINNER